MQEDSPGSALSLVRTGPAPWRAMTADLGRGSVSWGSWLPQRPSLHAHPAPIFLCSGRQGSASLLPGVTPGSIDIQCGLLARGPPTLQGFNLAKPWIPSLTCSLATVPGLSLSSGSGESARASVSEHVFLPKSSVLQSSSSLPQPSY